MELTSYLNLLSRHKKAIIILIILALIPAAYIGNQKRITTYDTTIFISIGTNSNSSDQSSILDDSEAADMFTETLQGWFKNPSFIKSINNDAIYNISASKQEKKNLLVTYSTNNKIKSAEAADSIKFHLEAKLAKYNIASGTGFNLAIFDINTESDSHSFTLYLLLGLLIGLMMGIIFSYGIEYIYGVTIHRWQIENILDRKTDDIIRNRKVENYNLSYILARIKDFNSKHITVAGIDFLPTSISRAINESNPKLNIKSVMFPDDAVTIAEHPLDPIIVVIQIGKSKLDNIQKIKHLLKKDFLLLTKE